MTSWTRLLACLLAALFVSASALQARDSIDYLKSIDKESTPEQGKEYYMRHCIWYENEACDTTNYTRGTLVPINTKVTLVELNGEKMSIRINSSREVVKIDNTRKYSKKSMSVIARNMLSSKEVPIEEFGREMAQNIRNGELHLGMTKEQVVMTRGWPPAHKTPSLDQNTWVYWTSRFATHTLVFRDGKLAEGRGLQ